jgi:Na+/proline symporter
MQPMVIGIALYLVVQFGIGIAVSRKIASESDYLVAGRNRSATRTAACRRSAR